MTVPILMYHSTCAGSPTSEFMVSGASFRLQMEYLRAHGYRTPPVDEALRADDAHAVIVSFDDGYRDNYEVALPILAELGMRAVVFAVADMKRRRNFWDRGKPLYGLPLLEPAHMREMARHGVTFGAHSVTHRRLTELGSLELDRELADSKQELEDVLGAAVDYLAYPFGACDARVKDAVARAGYRAAFAVNSGPLGVAGDRYEIRRVLVDDRASAPLMFAKTFGLEQAARWSTWACKKVLGSPLATLWRTA